MRYWDVFDLALRNIYAYAKNEDDFELLDLFQVFTWGYLKKGLIVATGGKIRPFDLTMEDYLEELVNKFKKTVREAGLLELAQKLKEKAVKKMDEIYEEYEKKAEGS